MASLRRRSRSFGIPLSIRLRSAGFWSWAGIGALACSTTNVVSDGGGGEDADDLAPPVVRLLGATTSAGTRVAADASEFELPCDARFVVEFDREANEGSGDPLFVLRPPGTCDDEDAACGYFRVTVLDADGAVVTKTEAAHWNVLVDLNDRTSEVTRLEAVLVQGDTREPFEIDGDTFSTTWDVRIRRAEGCEPGEGGAGGTSGATGGQTSMAGFGGVGGAD